MHIVHGFLLSKSSKAHCVERLRQLIEDLLLNTDYTQTLITVEVAEDKSI